MSVTRFTIGRIVIRQVRFAFGFAFEFFLFLLLFGQLFLALFVGVIGSCHGVLSSGEMCQLYCISASAWARSACRSATASSPIENRTRPPL